MLLLVAFAIFLAITLFLRCLFLWKYQYWKRRRIPHLEPRFPFGTMPNPFLMKEKGGNFISRLYKEIKDKSWKHAGLYVFATPVYLVTDLNYIKNILTKDFEYFVDRGLYYNKKDDPLSAHLLNLNGSEWNVLRRKLNGTFSSSKIRKMFQSLNNCVNNLIEKIEVEVADKPVIDIYKHFTNFTINVICWCALGLDCKENTLLENYANKFVVWSKFKWTLQILSSFYVELAKKLKIKTIPKEASEFFLSVITKTIRRRKKHGYIKNDFLQLLMEDTEITSATEIAAQCFLFFIAGFETSSSTLTFALYELAKNLDIQDRTRTEVNSVADLTYDSLSEMNFLDQVIQETLRKYPPLQYLTRKCTKDYKVPENNAVLEKGTFVVISILGIHYDEEYYPNPEKFDPGRFSRKNTNSRRSCTFLPFGEGPRICLGKRFALITIKFCLASLLRKYTFSLNQEITEPLVLRTDTIIVAPKDKILFNLQKI